MPVLNYHPSPPPLTQEALGRLAAEQIGVPVSWP